MLEAMFNDIRERIDTVEETYEFLLAYAAKGLSTEASIGSGAQIRDFLARTDAALTDIPELFDRLTQQEGLDDDSYQSFAQVLERDARSARAAVRLVRAQGSISSQLVDNLNASIHLRALLTDLFLLDEVLKTVESLNAAR